MFTIVSFLLMKKLQPEFCKTAGFIILLITMKTLYLRRFFIRALIQEQLRYNNKHKIVCKVNKIRINKRLIFEHKWYIAIQTKNLPLMILKTGIPKTEF